MANNRIPRDSPPARLTSSADKRDENANDVRSRVGADLAFAEAARNEAEHVLVAPLLTTLRQVRDILTAEHVSIEYAYCSSGGRNGKVFGIFKVTNAEKATRVLSESPNSRRLERRPLRDQRAYRK